MIEDEGKSNNISLLPMVDEIILLCLVAFGAGFIDAIVGGGGLLQTPAILILLPQYPIVTLLGTVKIPALSGTTLAAWKYSRKVSLNWNYLGIVAAIAFCGSLLGAYSASLVDNSVLKPSIFFVLILISIFTFFSKNFGLSQERSYLKNGAGFTSALIGFCIGFYDGMIGPGTGSFLILVFIALMGYDFLHASASAKIVNMATNLAAIFYFGSTGNILYEIAIPMAIFNMIGAYFGSRLALLKGNRFIRIFFLLVIFSTMLRFAYDIFLKD